METIRDGVAELRGEAARHLTRVLRAEAGQQYEISDNRAAYLAELTEARGDRAVFHVVEALPVPAPRVNVTLCAALIKFDHFEWIVEKATELGVTRIVPVGAARSDKGLFEAAAKRVERWERIARESSQQSRRVTMPEIAAPVKLERVLGMEAERRFFLDEDGAPLLPRVLPAERAASDSVALLIGPEGGWTEGEREGARVAGWTPAGLGPQILRAETAALAAIAILITSWAAE